MKKLMRLYDQYQADFGRGVPLRLIETLLVVSRQEGASMKEIAKMVDSPISTTCRDLLDLGARNRRGQPGYGFIEQRPDPIHFRRNQYQLTPKGAFVLKRWAQIMSD
jgi:DNA-binding MarR family transcriptional regulator